MSLHTGGCAINAATALARLAIPVEVIGKVGEDPFADFLMAEMHGRGIGTRGVRRDSTAGTSATMVMVDPDGERRFIHYIGANAHLCLDDVDFDLLSKAAILHVGGSLVLPSMDGEPTAELLRRARSDGIVTFLDTVWDDTGRWMKLLAPALPFVDYFLPSLPEAQAMTGLRDPDDVASALLDCGPGTVALKMGEEGCLVKTAQGERFRLPAYQVEAIDATGAGDAFVAGFIAGVYLDWSIEETCHLANAVGALCVTGVGASGGTRSLEETIDFMRRTPLRTLSKNL
jgi:sugar/nucleoside kinase (ribokinase family)